MLERALYTLVRAALLAELPAGVAVEQSQQPTTNGVNSGPTVFMQTIIPARRVGWVGRRESGPAMLHEEKQWLETTLQVSALAWRAPESAEPTAMDLCRMAADILQGDAGMALLGAHRVRPLRIGEVRVVYFVNERQQYEANPSFDVVLSHVQIREGATPPVSQFTGRAQGF